MITSPLCVEQHYREKQDRIPQSRAMRIRNVIEAKTEVRSMFCDNLPRARIKLMTTIVVSPAGQKQQIQVVYRATFTSHHTKKKEGHRSLSSALNRWRDIDL